MCGRGIGRGGIASRPGVVPALEKDQKGRSAPNKTRISMSFWSPRRKREFSRRIRYGLHHRYVADDVAAFQPALELPGCDHVDPLDWCAGILVDDPGGERIG